MNDQPTSDLGTNAPPDLPGAPRITVMGVGGAGGNAIDNMIRAKLEGVQFIAANTDAQALEQSLCGAQIQLGANVTKGLGAGSQPEVGQEAAEEALESVVTALRGSNMVFITAGMGGGTGTGAAPVIARAARELGVLSVGVVTKPFNFEGSHRMQQAEAGIAELSKHVDTLIVIPNQNLFLIAGRQTTFADAFRLTDEVLHSGVRGVTDLMVLPGLVNLDFSDVHTVMAGMGKAVMGTGEAEGDDRALQAAEAAITNPLLDDISVKGARSVLINISGGSDMMLMEVDEAANRVRQEVDPDANIIFGSAFNEALEGKIRVSVIATGSDLASVEQPEPNSGEPFVGGQDETTEAAPAVQVISEAQPPVEQTSVEILEPADEVEEVEESDEADDSDAVTLRLVGDVPVKLDPTAIQTEPEKPVSEVDYESSKFVWNEENSASNDDSEIDAAHDEAIDSGAQIDIPNPEEQTSSDSLTGHKGPSLVEKFRRSSRPAKSESVQEAAERERRSAQRDEDQPEAMRYVVWEVELGARVYKVPEDKVADLQSQPHANRFKLFDSLDNAKAEANSIFKRVAASREENGLPRSILQPTIDDIMSWDEQKVPTYFL